MPDSYVPRRDALVPVDYTPQADSPGFGDAINVIDHHDLNRADLVSAQGVPT